MTDQDDTIENKHVFQEPSYLRFWLARISSTLAFQMAAVAFGWQMYDLTNSTFALGMVGLVQFLPMLLVTFVVGHVADRFSRKTIISICQTLEAATLALLAVSSYFHKLQPSSIYLAVVALGVCRAFESPLMQAIVPGLVDGALVPQAIAWSASANQIATIGGPALGGLLYVEGAPVPYVIAGSLFVLAAMLSSSISPKQIRVEKQPDTIESIFAGFYYIREKPNILGAVTLDFFVVLLGGAIALFPAYAKDVLHTGPWGLGLLRLSPAVGGLLGSVYLAHYPIVRRAGYRMFTAMIVVGVATVAFALSRNIWLSMVILSIVGASDAISVVVRASLVQLETRDEMRNRVSAVNSLFIGTSNQLGFFESGVTASWFGVVPSTIIGGVGSIVIALVWMFLFPELRRLERLGEGPAKKHRIRAWGG